METRMLYNNRVSDVTSSTYKDVRAWSIGHAYSEVVKLRFIQNQVLWTNISPYNLLTLY